MTSTMTRWTATFLFQWPTEMIFLISISATQFDIMWTTTEPTIWPPDKSKVLLATRNLHDASVFLPNWCSGDLEMFLPTCAPRLCWFPMFIFYRLHRFIIQINQRCRASNYDWWPWPQQFFLPLPEVPLKWLDFLQSWLAPAHCASLSQ